ncbi:MAG TPA: hypothetical protein VFB72_16985, partial [Verrucomicrobiae bacterium]|nr:hypothetical protein [Verrucomicrobiae bacterium]
CFTSFQLVSPCFTYDKKFVRGEDVARAFLPAVSPTFPVGEARDFHAKPEGPFHLVSPCFSLFHLRRKICSGRRRSAGIPACRIADIHVSEARIFRAKPDGPFHLVSPRFILFHLRENFASGPSADGPAVRPYRRVPRILEAFHLVSACFTWLHLHHAKTR